MTTEQVKPSVQSDSKKLWILWVFGLGFFAGFVVNLLINNSASKKIQSKNEFQSEGIQNESIEPKHQTTSNGAEQTRDANHEKPTESLKAQESSSLDSEFILTKAMRDKLFAFDLLKLLQDAEIRKYRFEGETRGIQISKIRTGSVFDRLGFKDGDIIERVNGIAFMDIERNKSDFLSKIPGAESLEIAVRRNDKLKLIRVRVVDPADHK